MKKGEQREEERPWGGRGFGRTPHRFQKKNLRRGGTERVIQTGRVIPLRKSPVKNRIPEKENRGDIAPKEQKTKEKARYIYSGSGVAGKTHARYYTGCRMGNAPLLGCKQACEERVRRRNG